MPNPKPDGCLGCPLYEKGKGFVPDKIAPKALYIFCGEAPGTNEVTQREPFVGRAGHVLKQWLMHVVPEIRLAWEKGQVTLSNTLRCLPPEIQGRPYPKGEEKELAEQHCRQYDHFGDKAETMVLFGESPQRYWFKDELANEDASDRALSHDVKGVMGRIGRVYERDGKRWVFAPHPAFILRQPAIVEHGQQALRIATNTERVLEPNYLPWTQALEQLR